MWSEAEILSWGAPAECGSFSVAYDPKCLEALFAVGFTKLERFPFALKSCNLFFRKFRNIKTTGSQKWRTKHGLFTENARNLIRNFQTVGCWSLYSWMNSCLSREPTTWWLHLPVACFTLFFVQSEYCCEPIDFMLIFCKKEYRGVNFSQSFRRRIKLRCLKDYAA